MATAPELPELKDDPLERRRVLNVLAQRRYRRQKKARLAALEAEHASRSVTVAPASPVPSGPPTYALEYAENLQRATEADQLMDMNQLLLPYDCQPDPDSPAGFSTDDLLLPVSHIIDSRPTVPNDDHIVVDHFADYAITTPGLAVVRAKLDISRHLHGGDFVLNIWDPSAISPIFLGQETNDSIAELAPTPMQRCVEHHPLVDAMPWRSFRDRFLYIMTLPKHHRPKLAQQHMVALTLELMMAVKDASGGVRVWGCDPFCIDNWEVGPVFYAKFWWALDTEVIRISNRHRLKRGEPPLRLTNIEV